MSRETDLEASTRKPKPADEPLSVKVVRGRLVISIGVNVLAFAVTEGEGVMEGVRVTDPMAAADEIRRELQREEEDGTTLVHMLLDKAALAAWENGGEGFHYDD